MDIHILDEIKKESFNVAILVKDLKSNKILLSHNDERIFPSASIIKVIITMAVLKAINEGKLSLVDNINVAEDMYVNYSTIGEERCSSYTVDELIKWTLITSDNTATNVLIYLVGFDYINSLALELGLASTSLQRKMMDFDAIKNNKNNYTTVSDMLKVMELLYNKDFISGDVSQYLIDILMMQRDKEMLMRYIVDNLDIAHKTGELDNLNHDMGIIYLEEVDYFIGVFIDNCESNHLARKTIGKLSKEVYRWFNNEYRGKGK